MEVFTSDFSKGMSKDTSKTLVNKSSYLHANNFRLVTELGKSELSIENVRGNDLYLAIDATSSVIKFTIDKTQIPLGNVSCTFSFTMGSTTTTDTWSVNNLSGYSISEIYILLRDFINTSPAFIAGNYMAATKGESVVLHRDSGFFTSNGTIIVTVTQPWISFIETVPAIDYPKIMGRGYIRDTIIIFTTDTDNVTDDPIDLTSYMQLWELIVNPVTLAPSLTLIYNGLLHTTTAHPIPSVDGSVGRAENDLLQSIYWTDNYNSPRKLNIEDFDAFAILPEALSLRSLFTSSEIILDQIYQSGGGIKTGILNFAYRLASVSGNETVYSSVSNNINIVSSNEDTALYADYKQAVPGGITTKAVKCKISGVDTSYDNIEIVAIYRDSLEGLPEIPRFMLEPVPSSGNFEFVYTATESNVVDITLPEFNLRSINFLTVKSFADKNNYLFASNVKIADFTVNFDARAYRWTDVENLFNINGFLYDADKTYVQDSAGNTRLVDKTVPGSGASLWNIPFDHDAINNFQAPDSFDNLLYQSDGRTIGGEGPWIKYSFTNNTTTDSNFTPNTDIHLDSAGGQGGPSDGYVRVGRTPYTYDIGHENAYENRNMFRNFHSPYISGLLRGYFRDETYRLGIVFYSLAGVPSDVKWIGDIRMPSIYMWETDAGSPFYTLKVLKYPLAGGPLLTDSCLGFNLGIKFEIDISSIQEQISGFSFVRVERQQLDKTILGQGQFYAAYDQFDIVPVPNSIYQNTKLLRHPDPLITAAQDQWLTDGYFRTSTNYGSMNSPDFLFRPPPSLLAGDSIDVIDVMQRWTDWRILKDSTPIYNNHSFIYVFHDHYHKPNTTGQYPFALGNFPLSFTKALGPFYYDQNEFIDPGGPNTIINVSPGTGPGNPGQRQMGGATLFLKGAPSFGFLGPTVFSLDNIPGGNRYRVNYRRTVLKQYGGNTFAARTNNDYIYCGHFQPVTQLSAPLFSDIIVFGGDTYITMFDNVKGFKNYAQDPDWGISNENAEDSWFTAFAYPVETCVNTDLRSLPNSAVVNKNFLTDTITGLDIMEDFTLDPLWDRPNDVGVYFPKPLNAQDIEVFDHRTYASQPKVDGELSDSWAVFKVGDSQDVNSAHGPINSTCVLNDRFYFLQDRAIGTESINERVVTQDLTGIQLQLGSSGILSRYDYISTEVGTKHQWSVLPDPTGLYFYASTLNRFYVLNQNGLVPLSITKGMQSHFKNTYAGLINKDNPIVGAGVLTGKNPRYNEVLISFINAGESGTPVSDTLCYNTKIEQFTGFYSFHPKLYTNFNSELITAPITRDEPGLPNTLWLHEIGPYNSFYGVLGDSIIEVLVNPFPGEVKTFDNHDYHSAVLTSAGADVPNETFTQIRNTTDFQDTTALNLIVGNTINRKAERTWRYAIQRDGADGVSRLRDKFMITKLTYLNSANRKLILYYLNTFFRKSYR